MATIGTIRPYTKASDTSPAAGDKFIFDNATEGVKTIDWVALIAALQTELGNNMTVEEVADAAAREALTVTSGQIGKRLVRQADTGVFYIADSAGTGASVWTQWVTISDATTAVKGIVMLATSAETATGTDPAKAVTPAALKAGIASEINSRAYVQGLMISGAASPALATLGAAIGTGDLSVDFEFDVPTANPGTSRGLFKIGTSSLFTGVPHSLDVLLNTDGELEVFLWGSADTIAAKAEIANFISNHPGERVRITLTRSATTFLLYVNGNTQTYTETLTGGGSWAATINGTVVSAGFLTNISGQVGYFALKAALNRALTAAQVQSLMKHGVDPADVNGVLDNVNLLTAGGAWTNDSTSWDSAFASADGSAASGTSGGTTAPRLTHAITLVAGAHYRITGNSTLTSNGGGLTVESVTTGIGAPSQVIGTIAVGTTAIDLTWVEATGGSRAISLAAEGVRTMDVALTNLRIWKDGALLYPEPDAPGNGLIWSDVSGNGAHIVLPTSGVAWAKPSNAANRIRGRTSTNGNQALLGGAFVMPGCMIKSIRARARTGTPTVTLGYSSGGNQIVEAVVLSTGFKVLTIALPGGIINGGLITEAAEDLWANSNSTDVVEWDIAWEPLSF
jgi:hypothetical protein